MLVTSLYTTTANLLIKPNCISLSSQIPGKFFLHQKGLFPRHWFQIDMIIKTGTQIRSIFLNDICRQFVTFLVYVSGLMLFESFGWSLACHSHVQTFQHSVKLRIGRPESPVFSKNPLGKFNNIHLVYESRHRI